MSSLWAECLSQLQTKLSPNDFNQWLRPLQVTESASGLTIYTQNLFVMTWVQDNYFEEILDLARQISQNNDIKVILQVGLKPETQQRDQTPVDGNQHDLSQAQLQQRTGLNKHLTFESFVEGRSNRFARRIAEQVAENPGKFSHNPLSIYGSTGLGKSHLLHAIGNEVLKRNPKMKIRYVSSERFMNDRSSALFKKTIEEFKRYYRSLDILMIDDLQFLAKYVGKSQSSEEFLNTFNSLIESGKQVVVASDRYPQKLEGLEEKVRSRLTSGVTAEIEPPDLETRVAILIQKTKELGHHLDEDVAYFIAQKLRTDVRALESAVKNLTSWASFVGSPITIDSARERLKDMFESHSQLITIEKIQKLVTEYYKLAPDSLKSASRTRSIARPRQIAMALAKELTNHSLPEIGRDFGGRDHTTVMHAVKTINELRKTDMSVQEDYTLLTRKLSS